MKPLRVLVATALLSLGTASEATLPAPVAQALKTAKISDRNIAVVVRSVDGGPAWISHNPGQAMNPASVMKVLTTFAALEILGPSHSWSTEVLIDGPLVDGRLKGDLVLRGGGDPKLGLEQFWLLLRELRNRGLRDIEGDLILDRSAFALPPHDPAAFDQQPLRPYNVGADALLLNFGALGFSIVPGESKAAPRVIQSTPDNRVRIDNRLAGSTGECGDWREMLTPKFEGFTLQLNGSFAAACGEKQLSLSPFTAEIHAEGLFRTLWAELGGSLRGKVRDGRAPDSASLLLTHASPSLAEIVRDTNKFSNNVMARQLLLALAPRRPASPVDAIARLRQWLAAKNLDLSELVVENGAGLSRRERISADSLSRLLAAAWVSPVMPELMASLPLLGRDGTLRKRLDSSAAGGRAHLKTGYLENVRSVAGYVLDGNGKRWILVAIINDPNARAGKAALDALIDGVAAGR